MVTDDPNGPSPRRETPTQEPFETLVFDGDGTPALIDIEDNAAIQELMDAESGA